MAYLDQSTHFNNWIFQQDELTYIRRLCSLKAKRVLRLENEVKNDSTNENLTIPTRSPRSFAALIPNTSTATKDDTDERDEIYLNDQEKLKDIEENENQYILNSLSIKLLTMEQEQAFLSFYEAKIQDSCGQLFRTSEKVKCSAVMLFKRFYLSNSIMEFHPKYIVPTCIYVAGKVEEQYISVDTIAEQLNVDHTYVIGHEMLLLEGVRFQLIMYHPFRALLALVEDYRVYRKGVELKELPIDLLQKLHAMSCVIINEMLLTDLPLLHYPAYLALAAMCVVITATDMTNDVIESKVTLNDMKKCIEQSKFSKGIENVNQVWTRIMSIQETFTKIKQYKDAITTNEAATVEETKKIKSIYKQLRQFHPEEKIKSSKEKEKKKKNKDSKKRKSDDGNDKATKKKVKKEKSSNI